MDDPTFVSGARADLGTGASDSGGAFASLSAGIDAWDLAVLLLDGFREAEAGFDAASTGRTGTTGDACASKMPTKEIPFTVLLNCILRFIAYLLELG